MADTNPVDRFHDLAHRYDKEHGNGAALQVKDELGLGKGRFNDELTTEEVRKLNEELARRLSSASE